MPTFCGPSKFFKKQLQDFPNATITDATMEFNGDVDKLQENVFSFYYLEGFISVHHKYYYLNKENKILHGDWYDFKYPLDYFRRVPIIDNTITFEIKEFEGDDGIEGTAIIRIRFVDEMIDVIRTAY
jgi:hypothetical protein